MSSPMRAGESNPAQIALRVFSPARPGPPAALKKAPIVDRGGRLKWGDLKTSQHGHVVHGPYLGRGVWMENVSPSAVRRFAL